ncbi:MAG TPA: DUF4912 domain-containing protein [Verrucomicrobiae bacterium]|nr:DUF4912 domain-containing protein [Verrucomicrobiae bacterium]
MKKPKKTTTPAKPRAGRATPKRTTSTGETGKAAEIGKTAPGKKPVKRTKKVPAEEVAPAKPEHREIAPAETVFSAKATMSKASEKATLIIAAKTPVETESLAKPKGSEAASAGVKSTAPPPISAKPASLAGLVAEAKSEPEPISVLATEAKQAIRAARKAPAKIPTILFEGDKPEAAPVSGPGQRYALGPGAPVEKLKTEGELPESYETGEMLLTARDPHWLYAHWDLSDDQQRRYNAFSRDGHLIVRVHVEPRGKKPVAEVHVHPESRHWFVHVERANTRYVAELGYYSAADRWKVISTSCATLTPPDAVSADTSAEFTAIPFEVPMEKLLSLVKEAVHENAPLAAALQELRADGHPGLPQIEASSRGYNGGANPLWSGGTPHVAQARWTPGEWTPAQERALAEVVSMDHVRRVWMGSLEITELIRRQLAQEAPFAAAVELGELAPGAPTSPTEAIGGISSPSARQLERQKGFWFQVNAELIVYGATERDATVSIGGRKIKLRADGSFSYRFALPDGNYEMPIVAVSADQTDGRAAGMKFSRGTEYHGHVEAHPQDPALKQLLLENF